MLAPPIPPTAPAQSTPLQAAPPPGYAVMKRVDLQAAFHTAAPWRADIEAPTGVDAETGDAPVRVCITDGFAAHTGCEAITAGGYAFQTLIEAEVETLSSAADRRALVVRASFSGGAHTLTRTTQWTFTGAGFLKTFASNHGDVGEDERFASGPWDGYFVNADPAYTRPGETYWDPHRFSMDVYRLDPQTGGYLQVLQYVTARLYPAEREAKHQVIDGELPRIGRLLHVVYPAGPPR